ncbi:hypothetical protein [Streptomyces sp. NPDC055005]
MNKATLVKASAEEGLRRTLVFHHVVKEAEAFAAGLADVAEQLHASDHEPYPATLWANWLCGEHEPLHRRRVLAEFAEGVATDGTVVAVQPLGERHRQGREGLGQPQGQASPARHQRIQRCDGHTGTRRGDVRNDGLFGGA